MAQRQSKVSFDGGHGDKLSGELVRPLGRPRTWALFAHCFACSKRSHAARRVGDALALKGVGVLRFDFAGIGQSEGEFAISSFSGNVEDLRAAARFLQAEVGEPVSLLVGHSLGGAAVIAAATELPDVRAVATIGAPASPAHLGLKFKAQGEPLAEGAEACLEVGGHRICVDRTFLDDLERFDLETDVAGLRRPLLVLHAPRDEIVGIGEASKLFTTAKHPKSFVSLDDADHLLTGVADASYTAGVIAAWAERYLPVVVDQPPAEGAVEVRETGSGRFQQEVRVGRHLLIADEPTSVGGDDSGPSPYDLLAAALGVCTSMTMRLYAERKDLPLTGVTVDVRHAKVHRDDSEHTGSKIDRLTRTIALDGALDDEQRQRLLEIADRCPVHRTLERENEVTTELAP